MKYISKNIFKNYFELGKLSFYLGLFFLPSAVPISNDLETQALEIYYLEAISTDIIRESVGGFVNDTDTKQLLNEQLN